VPLKALTKTEIEYFGGYSTSMCRWSASLSQASNSHRIFSRTRLAWSLSHTKAASLKTLRLYFVTQTK
jgi:hypothetical protein